LTAFDLTIGASTPDVFEAQLNGMMMQVSKEVNIVADSSKLGKRSVSRIGPLEKIHRLITDSRAPRRILLMRFAKRVWKFLLPSLIAKPSPHAPGDRKAIGRATEKTPRKSCWASFSRPSARLSMPWS